MGFEEEEEEDKYYTFWVCGKCGAFSIGEGRDPDEAIGDGDVSFENHLIEEGDGIEGDGGTGYMGFGEVHGSIFSTGDMAK